MLNDSGPYGKIFICCCNRFHVNVLKGFWVLWDNIYVCVYTTLDFPVILQEQFTSSVRQCCMSTVDFNVKVHRHGHLVPTDCRIYCSVASDIVMSNGCRMQPASYNMRFSRKPQTNLEIATKTTTCECKILTKVTRIREEQRLYLEHLL
jgi:hypothetical protein